MSHKIYKLRYPLLSTSAPFHDCSAYLLVFHGSRDSRSQAAANALTDCFRQKVRYSAQIPEAVGQYLERWPTDVPSSPDPLAGDAATLLQDSPGDRPPLVQAAFLECHPQPLHQQIADFARLAQATLSSPNLAGDQVAPDNAQPVSVVLIPVFLLPGVHVMEDIPAEVEQAKQTLEPVVSLQITAHLGSHPGLRRILTERMATMPMEAWVLVAHGSRRPGANHPIERLAEYLGATIAYWSVNPMLLTQLTELAQAGFRQIGILPYFLFPGGTTDAIAQTVSQFEPPSTPHLTLTEPLNASPEIADLLLELR